MTSPLQKAATAAALLFVFLIAFPLPAAGQNNQPRMVFFDVFVSEELPDLRKSSALLTRAMSAELAALPEVQMLDQGTRDTLLLQRKFKLEDCGKAECRFAMAKALPGVDYMLEAEVEPFGRQCTLSMRVKDVRKGTIASSLFETMDCAPENVLSTLRATSRRIWPPARRKPVAAPAAPAPAKRRTVEVPGGSPGGSLLAARANLATLQVESTPPAWVYVDGERLGRTSEPLRIGEGERRISIRKRDHVAEEFSLAVKPGESLRREVSLNPGPRDFWFTLGSGLLYVVSREETGYYIAESDSSSESFPTDLSVFGAGSSPFHGFDFRLEFGKAWWFSGAWFRYFQIWPDHDREGYYLDNDFEAYQFGGRFGTNWFWGPARFAASLDTGLEIFEADDDDERLMLGGTLGMGLQAYGNLGLEVAAYIDTSGTPAVYGTIVAGLEPMSWFSLAGWAD